MQYLFEDWDSLKRRLLRSRHILLCADFDGSITPIRARPKEVFLEEKMRLLLRRISSFNSFSVGVISGRALNELKAKVALKGLIYAGNHGLEIAYNKKRFIYPAAKQFIPAISKIAQELKRGLAPFAGVVLEEKGLTLSLHYRLVKKERLTRLKKIFLQTIKPDLTSRRIKLTYGKKVWEIRPPIEWDKGKALLWFLGKLRYKRTLAIFIGDDLTDEDAFYAVNKIRGISILVGRRKKSLARYYLKGIQDVQRFLEILNDTFNTNSR
jgi:trehalose 6-phosphate phosphatase